MECLSRLVVLSASIYSGRLLHSYSLPTTTTTTPYCYYYYNRLLRIPVNPKPHHIIPAKVRDWKPSDPQTSHSTYALVMIDRLSTE
ncbi:hypothetical protein BU24DRAFT_37331 [Aaosphaeria arxii CBS 175.79]|uniref:Uncharacterized protein n=1 Tax=Aaosphaeria arxii CBS 175.79 TaxID=1450172 RepID=A0A6A5Y916_9PLEO|nr:uncharacterized protein BU24DRAFT_37331 [Aaosphaeria arxii CBS 175.79]KAF2022092.1 hypothetical protein BU24DRAFT_37331 [Aaosphaeria arxii CBS 175.79]